MPNHCENVLSIVGDKEEVSRFVKQANGPVPNYPPTFEGDVVEEDRSKVLSFHQLIPIPDEVMAKPYGKMGVYGGYEAEKNLWGVKWGAYDEVLDDHSDGIAKYKFTTAWSTPKFFLTKVSKQFPSLTFFLSFKEESPSRGRFAIHNGEILEETDDSYKEMQEDGMPEYCEDLANTVEEYEDIHYEECQKIEGKYIDCHDEWVADHG